MTSPGSDTISTFAELADLMEPEWNIERIQTTGADGAETLTLTLKKEPCDLWVTWNTLRFVPGTFAKFTGGSNMDGTQTITITLEPT